MSKGMRGVKTNLTFISGDAARTITTVYLVVPHLVTTISEQGKMIEEPRYRYVLRRR